MGGALRFRTHMAKPAVEAPLCAQCLMMGYTECANLVMAGDQINIFQGLSPYHTAERRSARALAEMYKNKAEICRSTASTTSQT